MHNLGLNDIGKAIADWVGILQKEEVCKRYMEDTENTD